MVPGRPGYGDQHPRFGFPGGENGVEELAAFLRGLFEIGYLEQVPDAAPLVADLLTSPDVARVRECDASNCAWLFLDRSKNRTRRWCDMKVCGNRDKARRYRARTPSGRTRRAGGRAVRPRQP
jgi:hypothetical protein